MHIEVLQRPGNAAAKVTLDAGESVTAEVGSMIAMSSSLQVETTTRTGKSGGGIMAGLKRLLSGENFFLNHFRSSASGQEVILAPTLPGDIVSHRLRSGKLMIQGSSWMASGPGVDLDISWQGLGNALFSGESALWIKCGGEGDVLLNAFGAIYEVDVKDGYTVDTGHIVAFEDSLSFDVGKAGGSWLSSILGGEGLVCHFKGQGKLYCQTHNPGSFGTTLGGMLRPRKH